MEFESKLEEERKSPFKGCSFENRFFRDEAVNWLKDGELRFSPSQERLLNKLRCDNGPGMTSRHFLDWAYQRRIDVEYIDPVKPIQNAYIEIVQFADRGECLNEEVI